MSNNKTRINHQIRASELRVIGPDGSNIGILSLKDALEKAREMSFDLIEISPNANPPVAKIMDYGKFQYLENKKQKLAKTKVHTQEIKNIQVSISIGDHDLEMKSKQASGFLKEGNKVRITLTLRGRAKYLNKDFLKERLARLLKFLTEEYKVTEESKQGPKGITMVIEKAK